MGGCDGETESGSAFAGGDVSSKEIVVALERDDGQRERATFADTGAGHRPVSGVRFPTAFA
jgi:hypothetical protein